MKKMLTIVLLISMICSCNNSSVMNENIKPIYSDFQNQLEELNLYSKVKKLETYRDDYQNGKKLGQPILDVVQEFTEFGSFSKTAYNQGFGKVFYTDEYFYNEDQDVIKHLTSSDQYDIEANLTYSQDSIYKISTANLTIDDSEKYKVILTNDSNDYLLKMVEISVNDTIVKDYKYKFNSENKILSKEVIGEYGFINSESYEYNSNNRIEKFTNKVGEMTFIKESVWENNLLKKQLDYSIQNASQAHLDKVTYFDNLFNPISVEHYEKSKLKKVLKYKYKFDEFGNWILRQVLMQETSHSNKFLPVYEESRKIEYWNEIN